MTIASIERNLTLANRAVAAYGAALSGRGLRFVATNDATAGNCQIDIWIPGDAMPRVVTHGVAGSSTQKVPGGWTVTGCGRGTYAVTVAG